MTREEAIKRIKVRFDKLALDDKDIKAIQTLIPELCENEDERIRKKCIELIKRVIPSGNTHSQESKEILDCIAYLEKQKEQNLELYYDKELDSAARKFYFSGGADSPVDSTGLVPIVRMAEFGATWMKKKMEKEQKPTEELVYRMNGLMQEYVKSGKDEEEQEHRLKCYHLFWDALGDSEFFKQKEQKPSINIDQLKSLMLQYLQEAANEKDDSDIEADTDKWARKILGYDFEQKPVEFLSKRKVYDIMNKLTELSTSELIPFESEEYVKIHEITSDVNSLLDYPIEQKPVEKLEDIHNRGYVKGVKDAYNNVNEAKVILKKLEKENPKPVEWKPTKEQMVALNWAADGMLDNRSLVAGDIKAGLRSLYNDLQTKSIQTVEWSEEDSDNLERVDNYLWMLDDYVGDDYAMPQGKTDNIRGNIQGILSPWLKSLPERFNLQQIQEWSDEDESQLDDIEKAISNYYDLNHAPQYHYWLEQKLKSIRSQPKQEWSEKDEKILNELLDHCNTENATWYNWLKSLRPPLKDKEMKLKILKYLSTRCSSLEFEEVENYLNNLRPSWKPSEEQMEALDKVLYYVPEEIGIPIAEIYGHFNKMKKKLM